MSTKVAVVTGSNKGIGFAIVKGLLQKFDGDVFLTARNEERGLAAVDELKKAGLAPKFHQLNIDEAASIERLRDFMKANYGGIDVLVNNAAIAFKNSSTEPFAHQAKVTVHTNFFSVKQACDILFPILKDGARVVNMSSSCGYLGQIKGKEPESGKLREKFGSSDSTLTVEELCEMMNAFVEAAEAGNHRDFGWPSNTYVVSKVGLSALSRIQQRQFNDDPRKDLVVNHVHPGYVDTDMTSHRGPLTLDEGARSSIFAALLPENTKIRGQYIWEDCAVRNWIDDRLPPPV